MNEQVKSPEAGAAPDSAADSAAAPGVDNVGAADQSQQTGDAGAVGAESGAGTEAQPESAFAGAAGSDASTESFVSASKGEDGKSVVIETVVTPAPVAPKVVTPPPPAPAPVVQTTSAPAQPSSALSGPTKYEEVNRALAGVPANKLGIIHFLTEYSAAMAPRRPITDKDGSVLQAQLYNQLINLINKEEEHFSQLWSGVLRYVEKEITGVFSHTHAFRFMDNIPLNPDQQSAFASLIHLLRLTGPVQSRKENLKQVSLDKTLQKGVTDSGRQRVLAFYAD